MQADKLRELLEAANPALPWTARADGRDTEVVDANNDTVCDDVYYYPAAVDASHQHLIAAAINALPELLAIAEASEGLRADAMRYRLLRGKAKQNTAYDVFGNGGHWQIGLHSNDNRLSLDAAIDRALSGAVTQGEG